jgi:serine/threonine-protein phosphatase 2B regulatory subunit
MVVLLTPQPTECTSQDLLLALLALPTGVVSRDDLEIMVRQLAGSTLSDDDVKELVTAALAEAGSNSKGLSLQAFKAALKDQDLRGMVVDIPTEL